jgi:hypothetical protein
MDYFQKAWVNNMKKTSIAFITSTLACAILTPNTSSALDQIVRQYRTVRSSGMGGVFLTTGRYDDNFFGNPAQATQDPKWKIQLADVSVESTSTTFSTAQDVGSGGGDMLNKISSTAGKNNHARIQTAMPAVYIPNARGSKMTYAVGMFSQIQADLDLRNSFQINPQTVTDIGPAFTVARKFLELDRLSVGVTGHFTYRLQSKSGYTMVDLIKGNSPASIKDSGEGARIDADLGARYLLPWTYKEYEFSVGAAINNIKGGAYNVSMALANTGTKPDPLNRTLGLGVSARRASLWKFTNTVFALDLTDIGNNPGGNMFRLVHIGAETNWKAFSPRLGINQGYLCAGLGINLRFLELEFATYGEEMSLNPGQLEDRRYSMKIALQI